MDASRSKVAQTLRSIKDDIEIYCQGKSPWPRAAVTLYLAYVGIRCTLDDRYVSLFSGITMVIHEIGHFVLRPFGLTMHVMGGTLFQLGAPVAAAIYLLKKQRDWFGFAFGLAWLSFSTWYTAWYISTANKSDFDYVALGEGTPIHDWYYMLTGLHLLNACREIGSVVQVLAFLIWAFAIFLAAMITVRMIRSRV
jgi:hypothetical protein